MDGFLFTESKLWLLISNQMNPHFNRFLKIKNQESPLTPRTPTLKNPLTLLPSNMMTTSLCAYSWISVSQAWNNRSRHSNELTVSPAKQEGSVILCDLTSNSICRIISVVPLLILPQGSDESQTYPDVVKGGFAGDVIKEKQRWGDKHTPENCDKTAAAHFYNTTLKITQRSVTSCARLTVRVSIIGMCHTSKPLLPCRVPNLWWEWEENEKMHIVTRPGSTWLALISSDNTGGQEDAGRRTKNSLPLCKHLDFSLELIYWPGVWP